MEDRSQGAMAGKVSALPTGGYREIRPSPVLAPSVDCFWVRRGSLPPGAAQRNRILPDGRIDIVFVFGDAPERVDLGSGVGSYAVGAMRRALVLELVGQVEFLGVRFAAGAAASFLGLPAVEITDRSLALEACWGLSALDLEERLLRAAPGQRVRLLEAELEARLIRSGPPPDLVLAASSLIAERIGRITVSELCRTLGVGERRLRRLFANSVGLSPKEACRVARFVHAAELLRQREGSDLGRVSFQAGYYDQPHFIREFRRLSGLTPGRYLAERRAVRSVQSSAAGLE